MSKLCQNCGMKMPDEANICLNCLTVYGNRSASAGINAISKRHKHFKTREYINRFRALSKKRKAAIAVPLLCLIALIPFTAYMLSPVDGAYKTNAAISEQDSTGENKPITRAEAILNRILGNDNGTNENLVPEQGNSLSSTDTNKENTAGGSNINENSDSKNQSDQNTNSSPNDSSGQDDTNNLPPVLNYNDWEYKINSANKLEITKYTGNDKNVLVPDQIEGTNVERIAEKTFSGNANIQSVTFKDSETYHCVTISSQTFYDLPQLRKIVFPKNTDFVFNFEFAVKTPVLTDIEIDHWQAKFVDGVFYWDESGIKKYSMYVYCEGNTASTFTVPDFCGGISCGRNISNCKYLKVLNLHKNCSPPQQQDFIDHIYPYLEAINIAPESENKYYSYNGAVFAYGNILGGTYSSKLYIYPGAKADKEFHFPENCYIDFPVVPKGAKPVLETIYIPSTSMLADPEHLYARLPNLKTVKIQKGNPDFTKYQTYLGYDYNVTQYE